MKGIRMRTSTWLMIGAMLVIGLTVIIYTAATPLCARGTTLSVGDYIYFDEIKEAVDLINRGSFSKLRKKKKKWSRCFSRSGYEAAVTYIKGRKACEAKDYSKTIKYLQLVATDEFARGIPDVHFCYGMALFKVDTRDDDERERNRGRAKSHLDRFVKLVPRDSPSHREATEVLARLDTSTRRPAAALERPETVFRAADPVAELVSDPLATSPDEHAETPTPDAETPDRIVVVPEPEESVAAPVVQEAETSPPPERPPHRHPDRSRGATIVWVNELSASDASESRSDVTSSEQPRLRLSSQEVAFEELPGSIVLLHYWASWCAPCIKELPNFLDYIDSEKFAELRRQGVAAVLVTVDDFVGVGESFLEARHLEVADLYHDPDYEVLTDITGSPQVPVTIVLRVADHEILGTLSTSEWDHETHSILVEILNGSIGVTSDKEN